MSDRLLPSVSPSPSSCRVNVRRRRRAVGLLAVREWRGVFMGPNSLLAPKGFGVAPTPWMAVPNAAWRTVGSEQVVGLALHRPPLAGPRSRSTSALRVMRAVPHGGNPRVSI